MPFKMRTGESIGTKELFGVEEDDFKKQLASGAEAKSSVDSLKTTMDTQFNEIKASLAALAGNRPPNGGDGGNGGGSNGNEPPSLDTSDPTKVALAVGVNATNIAMGAVVTSLKSQMRDSMEDGGTFKYPYWDYLQPEIEALTKGDPLVQKQSPAYWENAYYICWARNQKKIADNKVAGRRGFTESVSGSTTDGTGSSNKTNTNEPTEIDKQQAAKFKMPIEAYMKSKGQLRMVGV